MLANVAANTIATGMPPRKSVLHAGCQGEMDLTWPLCHAIFHSRHDESVRYGHRTSKPARHARTAVRGDRPQLPHRRRQPAFMRCLWDSLLYTSDAADD